MKKILKAFMIFVLGLVLISCNDNNEDYINNLFKSINEEVGNVIEEETTLVNTYKGVSVRYSCDHPEVISETGKITIPSKDINCELTIYITIDGVEYSQKYEVLVKGNSASNDLNKAIEEGKTSLKREFDSYDKNNYTDDNYQELKKLYEQGIKEISNAKTEAEIEGILGDYSLFFSDVEKKEITNTLEKAIEEGKASLKLKFDSYDKNDYTDDNYQELNKLYEQGIKEITNAKSEAEIKDILEDYSLLFSSVEKKKITNTLEEQINKTKEELTNIYKVLLTNEYSTFNYCLLQDTYKEGIQKIENSKTIEECEELFNTYKTKLESIEHIVVDLNSLINEALEDLEDLFKEINKDKYTEENYQKIVNIYNQGKLDIANVKTKEELVNIYDKILFDIDSVEITLSFLDKIFDIEDDLDDILSLSGMTISKDINLRTKSLYNSTIEWSSSNEAILSNTGKVGEKVNRTKVVLSYTIYLDGESYIGDSFDIYVSTNLSLPDYYKSINLSLTGNSLKIELRTLVKNTHKKILTYDDLKTKTALTDADPNKKGNIILFYTRLSVSSKWDSGGTWNREHVWPQSTGGFGTSGAGADIHHLRPTNPSANTSRGNHPYGEIANRNSYVKKVNGVNYGYLRSGVFEPLDGVKGDVARIIFYLLLRYAELENKSITCVAQSMDMLLKWNAQDPVDDSEKLRNEKAYEIQGNRNPFIDNPEFANAIFSKTSANNATTASPVQVEVSEFNNKIVDIAYLNNKYNGVY